MKLEDEKKALLFLKFEPEINLYFPQNLVSHDRQEMLTNRGNRQQVQRRVTDQPVQS